MRQWLSWVVIAVLAGALVFQTGALRRLRAVEQRRDQLAGSVFRYAVRRADFQSFSTALERLAAAQGVTETVAQFKEAQTLAVAFTDDLLMLNGLRYTGQSIGAGLQYGDYLYNPATPEQEALQWKILRTRPYTLLKNMEGKFYVNEGVMQENDRAALQALNEQIRATAAIMEGVRATIDSPHDLTNVAAGQMEKLTEPLQVLEQVVSQYEASLPSLEPKPGSLYYRLYPTPKPSGQ